jgi:hypothetical protein
MVVGLLASISAYGNGWGSGLNFVPVTAETVATDKDGNEITLVPGTPIFVDPSAVTLVTSVETIATDEHGHDITLMPGTLVLVDPSSDVQITSARFKERPFVRRVYMDRTALPIQLAGFRAYQRGDFSRSTMLLESEAAGEPEPLVKSWKYILAGHSFLLIDMVNSQKAIALYRLAAQDSSSLFQAHAQYFIFRAQLNRKEFEEARASLDVYRSIRSNGTAAGSLLFGTYPQNSPLTAWGHGSLAEDDGPAGTFDTFIDAKRAFDARADVEAEAERAEICYAFAMATEALWLAFPEEFFDNSSSPDTPALLKLTFDEYPATEGAAKAYYHWLGYQQYWDFDGEPDKWQRQQKELMDRFLSKYPDSSLAPEARERLSNATKAIVDNDGVSGEEETATD